MKRILCMMIVVVFSAVLLSGCSYNFSTDFSNGSSTDSGDTSMEGSELTELEILAGVGKVTITKSTGSKVEIHYDKNIRGFSKDVKEVSDQISIDTETSGEKLIVSVTTKDTDGKDFWQWLSSKYKNINVSVDLDIKVPENINTFTVNDGVGDIKLNDVKGKIVVNNGVGSIKLDGVTMVDTCEINNGTGDITVNANIDDVSSLKVLTGVGRIAIKLPEDSKFSLDALTGVGKIDGNLIKNSDGFVGEALKQDVNGGGTKVKVEVGTGDISISKN